MSSFQVLQGRNRSGQHISVSFIDKSRHTVAILENRFQGWQQKQDLREVTECAQWFCPLSFSITQIDIRRKRQDGTGQWLLKSDVFQNWISGLERVLFCHGIRKSASECVFDVGY